MKEHEKATLKSGEHTSEYFNSCGSNDDAYWESRNERDHLISWQILRDNLPESAKDIADELALLRSPKVFINLPIENIIKTFKRMEPMAVKNGQTIIEQGDAGDTFYIIKQGTAEVWQQGLYDSEQKSVALLNAGDHFGEEALVTGGTRNASIKMLEDGILLKLSADDFQTLISQPILDEVDHTNALTMITDGVKVLDVRYEEEFEEQHLPDVLLIPLPELRDRLSEIDLNEKYITVCLSGKRSAVASMILKQNNYKVVSLKGGLRDWPGEMVSEY